MKKKSIKSTRICPVCHSQITTLFYKKNRLVPTESFTPSSSDFGIFYDLYRCDACHTVFVSERLPEHVTAKLYECSQHDGYMLEQGNRRRNFRRLVKVIAQYLGSSEKKSLLDIGASAGVFLDTVREAFPHWDLSGVEPSTDAVKKCEDIFHIKLQQGVFEETEIEHEKYDVITMLDLIEHVHNPSRVIEAAYRCLKPGGLMLITTPNIQSWTARFFRRRWWSFRLMHTLYFSPLSIRQMLAKEGFRVVKMRGLIRLFSLRYCLRHLGWTIRGPSVVIPFPLSLGDMLVIARKETTVSSAGETKEEQIKQEPLLD